MTTTQPTNFLESNALLYAQTAEWAEMHNTLDELLPGELRSLYRAANRLRLTIWDRLGQPSGLGLSDRAVPDPRVDADRDAALLAQLAELGERTTTCVHGYGPLDSCSTCD